MKNSIIKLLTIAALAGSITACSGSGSHDGKDTVGDRDERHDETGQLDTNKSTTSTGDAANLDNSGSGGTKATKDSVRMDSTKSDNR